MSVLAVEDLHVWFELPDDKELHAVQGVSFALERGERMGLVGESGCGKTTAILAMMGLLPPNASAAGRILLDGEDILAGGDATMRPHRWNDIAMVFQGAMNAFDPVKTIGSQIQEPIETAGLAKGKAARARTAELLELLRDATVLGLSPTGARLLELAEDERERLVSVTRDVPPEVFVRSFQVMLEVQEQVARAPRPRAPLPRAGADPE